MGFVSPIYEVSKKEYFRFDAALWHTHSLNILDKYAERSEVLLRSIKMISDDNVNPDDYIERIIHQELDIDLYEVTTSKSPHDWSM